MAKRGFRMVAVVLFISLAILPGILSVDATTVPAASKSNGSFIIELWDGRTYKQVATLSTNELQKELLVDIGSLTNPQLRVRKAAEGLAFLDSVMLDGVAAGNNAKLLKTDYDVQEIITDGVVLYFTGRFDGHLCLTGRIEPKEIIGEPFMFPFGNTYIKDPQNFNSFFTYELGSSHRPIQVDGEYEDLGLAFESRYLAPATGHPNGYAHIYISNDSEYLYACADFTSDNTFDYGDDFFTVFAKVDGVVKEFKQTSSGREFGFGSMQYTDKVAYEHMYYELKIPLDAFGSTDKLQLAFSLYGTAAMASITSNPASLSFASGQTANGILRIANYTPDSTLTEISYDNSPELNVQFHISPLPEPDSDNYLDIPYTVECAVPGSYSISVTGITIDGVNYNASPTLLIPVEVSASAAVSITTQPEDLTVTAGESAIFSVEASGTTPYTYQWEKSKDDGVSFSPILGATTHTLTLNDVTIADNGTQYRCIVNNLLDSPATSTAATMTVTAPQITGLPKTYAMYTGNSVTWNPQPSGGTWEWDEEFFSAAFNSPATFTALKSGSSSISYTVNDTSHFISVTVNSSLPATGQGLNYYVLIGAAACLMAAAVMLYGKHRARE